MPYYLHHRRRLNSDHRPRLSPRSPMIAKSARLILLATLLGIFFWFLLHSLISSTPIEPPESPRDVSDAPNKKYQAPAKAKDDDVAHPMISFSLAAIVRKRSQPDQEQRPQEYVMVHDKPPRGWWLTGGGIEHIDATPVEGAIRETLEEAAPSLLPQLTLLQSKSKNAAPELSSLPSMTHLLSLEQSARGRIRFIFRGEWIDDSDEVMTTNQSSKSEEPSSFLKCPPGDEESIEARWITWDELQRFERKRPTEINKSVPSLLSTPDPWLRGHEPITFFGMLEHSYHEDGSVPGLPVRRLNSVTEDGEVTGAFFGGESFSSTAGLLNHGRRAALLTHLKCRLLVYNEKEQTFATDATSKMFPSSFVKEKNETLSHLVGGTIKQFASSDSEEKEKNQAGLLRVEYVKHENGREATLTVFPFLRLHSAQGGAIGAMDWVSAADLIDNLERKLAQAIVDDQSRKKYLHLDVLAVPKSVNSSQTRNS